MAELKSQLNTEKERNDQEKENVSLCCQAHAPVRAIFSIIYQGFSRNFSKGGRSIERHALDLINMSEWDYFGKS